MEVRPLNLFIFGLLLKTLTIIKCDSTDTRFVDGREIPSQQEALHIIKTLFENYLFKNSVNQAYDVDTPSVKILPPSQNRKQHFDMKLAFVARPRVSKSSHDFSFYNPGADWRGERNYLYCTVFVKKSVEHKGFVGRSTSCLPSYKYELMDPVYMHATKKP